MRLLVIVWLAIVCSSCGGIGKHEEIPDFQFLMIDSVTRFNTAQIPVGSPFVMVYFSPDCKSCQEETEDLLANIDKFNGIRFYFLTSDSLDRLKVFNEYYLINRYSNIILGMDVNNSFVEKFRPSGTPYLVICNKRKQVEAVFSGGASSAKLLKVFKEIN